MTDSPTVAPRRTAHTGSPHIVAVGAHILDTSLLPVEAIPEGQGGVLVDEISMSVAGPAGGTAVVLAKLGAMVTSAGAVGDDAAGELLVTLLRRAGVSTDGIARVALPTSASVLPIRADGSRPSFHIVGANAAISSSIDWELIDSADHLHLGGPEYLGAASARQILTTAKRNGATTSMDLVTQGAPDALPMLRELLPKVDYLLPNDEQVLGWTAAETLAEGVQTLLDLGAGVVAATAGPNPVVVGDADGLRSVPVFSVPVVDTTGCGDSFSAGFLVARLLLGESTTDAARFGAAVAAHVAQGIGSGHGTFTTESIQSYRHRPPIESLSQFVSA